MVTGQLLGKNSSGPELAANRGPAGPLPVRSRLAPTPSGYLHLGNALNFILTWLLVRHRGGVLKLRIDDGDADRSRPEYVEDIFRQLEWLGLDWDEGPTGPADFAAHHSQLRRLERYRTLLAEFGERAELFYCTCSRRQISQDRNRTTAPGLYPGSCRARRQLPAEPHTIRVRLPEDWATTLPLLPEIAAEAAAVPIRPAAELGDFILWRRDDLPAYQLASLADDLDDRINLIVRGEDLLPSSAAQLFLASRLGLAGEGFARIIFRHHPLLSAADGRKLSKSDRALSLAAMRQGGAEPADIYQEAARFLGLAPRAISTLDELLAAAAPSEKAYSLPEPTTVGITSL